MGEPRESSAGAGARTGDTVRPPGELVQAVYHRLHELARGYRRREGNGRLLQTTALVHEAYLRLLREDKEAWTERQFLAAAAEAMRRILVEQARYDGRRKRGGGRERVPLSGIVAEEEAGPTLDVLGLDAALDELAREDPRAHEVVLLRFFAKLEMAQIAEVLGVTVRTVDRDWRCARLWLAERMEGASP